jgi:hypothetical protein
MTSVLKDVLRQGGNPAGVYSGRRVQRLGSVRPLPCSDAESTRTPREEDHPFYALGFHVLRSLRRGNS